MSDTTLNDFEDALRELGRHDVLVARTHEMAREAGWIEGELETAQDSSPVHGKGAVKDTYNLLGDAIRKLLRGIAKAQGEKPLATATRYGAEDLFRRSTKATANIDWSSPDARRGFLQQLVETAETLIGAVDPREAWGVRPSVVEAVALVRKILAQDIERDAEGRVRLRQGVAEDRLISVHDREMRRGHKTQSEAFEGYKFHHTVELTRMVRLGARIARVFGMVKVRAQTAFIAAAREPRTIGDAARDGDCRCPLNPPRATAPEPQPRSPPRTRTPPCPEPRAAA